MDSVIAIKLVGAFFAAFIAGGINSVAGGGTMISFPALVGLGLPAITANATNTIGIWPGSIGSVWGFRRELERVQRRFWWLLIPAMIGGGRRGIFTADHAGKHFRFYRALAAAVCYGAFIVQAPVRKRLERWIGSNDTGSADGRWMAIACGLQLFVGVYGGYFGAGMSIMMLAVLGVVGMTDILEMNAMTSILAGGINGVAGILFAIAHLVSWPYIAIMAPSSVAGSPPA